MFFLLVEEKRLEGVAGGRRPHARQEKWGTREGGGAGVRTNRMHRRDERAARGRAFVCVATARSKARVGLGLLVSCDYMCVRHGLVGSFGLGQCADQVVGCEGGGFLVRYFGFYLFLLKTPDLRSHFFLSYQRIPKTDHTE